MIPHRPYHGPFPDDMVTSRAVIDGLLSGTGVTSADILSGRKWPGARLLSSGPIVLAQGVGVMTAPEGMPWPGGEGSTWGGRSIVRLPGGSLSVGGLTIVAALILSRIKSDAERAATEAAITRFSLDRTQAADVLAAYAYQWTRRMGTRLFPRLMWTDPVLEEAAQAVMRYERSHPGMLDAAIGGDYAAQQALNTLVESPTWGDVDFISERRISTVSDPALSTDGSVARSKVGPQQMQVWQAHHLIPFGVMKRQPQALQLAAVAAGWILDSVENLIALPANYATFLGAPNLQARPFHAGSHPGYDADVSVGLVPLATNVYTMSPPALRVALTAVELFMTGRILSGRYHDRVS